MLASEALSQSGSDTVIGKPADSEATGGAVLRWTAPGDDGYVGRATGYHIRYQLASLGPLDAEAEWQAATVVLNSPAPSPAGQTDSVTVIGLEPATSYYFALRTFDEVYNFSEISNTPLIEAVVMSCCQGTVGDVNGWGGDEPTIGDVSLLVDHLFINQPELDCVLEADIDQSGGLNPQQGPGGHITISDIAWLIDHLFIDQQPLHDCF